MINGKLSKQRSQRRAKTMRLTGRFVEFLRLSKRDATEGCEVFCFKSHSGNPRPVCLWPPNQVRDSDGCARFKAQLLPALHIDQHPRKPQDKTCSNALICAKIETTFDYKHSLYVLNTSLQALKDAAHLWLERTQEDRTNHKIHRITRPYQTPSPPKPPSTNPVTESCQI